MKIKKHCQEYIPDNAFLCYTTIKIFYNLDKGEKMHEEYKRIIKK